MKKFLLLILGIIIGIVVGVSLDQLFIKSYKIDKSYEMDELFKIYGSDKKAENPEVNFYILIPKNLSLIQKLNIIADKLSRFGFNYLPIEVLKIEEQNSKKIVVINLKEHEWDRGEENFIGSNWRYGFFQGSTGGYFTTITLIETFLQNDYKGEWIDGVRFMYENQPIKQEDWDHIDLSGIIYRNQEIKNNQFRED